MTIAAHHARLNSCIGFFHKYGKGAHGLWQVPDTRTYRDEYRNKYVITGASEPLASMNFNTPLEAVLAFTLHNGLWPEFVLWYGSQPLEVTDGHPVE